MKRKDHGRRKYPVITGNSSLIIKLPAPDRKGGRSLMEALWRRKTVRSISPRTLPLGLLSNLLWAAAGVNRAHGPFGDLGRTAATASNSQEIKLYVCLAAGTYLYEPASHILDLVTSQDLRRFAIGRGQGNGADAAVRLVYAVDIARYDSAGFPEPGLKKPETQKSYYYSAAGLMAGNVYLFAAANGLAAWFHNCDRTALAEKLSLGPGQSALFGQTVGFPAKS